MSDDNFLSRWSRRKSEARKEPTPAAVADPPAAGIVPESPAPVKENPPEPLPPLDSLTPESDFTPFMKTEVDPAMRRAALKTLFQDPRFNVMDGLDVYIDDYSKPDPLPAGWLEKMRGFAALDAHKVLDARPEAPPEEASALPRDGEKVDGEQPLEPSADTASSDTPDAGSKSTQLRES